jgi:hypothetical protein
MLGYTIGSDKPVLLTLNDAHKAPMKRQVELGLFDPQRLKRYRNGTDLANIIRDALGAYRQTAAALFLDQRQPLYFQYHLARIKFATSYFVCVKQQNWVCVSMTMRQTIGYPRSCLPRSRLVSGSLPFAFAAHGSQAPRSTICVPSRLPVSPTPPKHQVPC